MKNNGDEIMDQFAEASNTLIELVDTNDDYAMLSICVKFQDETPTQEGFIETNIAANGYFGVLEEGIYSELLDQVQRGDMRLFSTIRNAIRDVEEEIGLSPDEDIDVEGDTNAKTLH